MEKGKFVKKHKKEIITYFIIFIIMLLLNRAKIINTINPFGFSFLFSLVYLGKNIFILAPIYLVSYIIFNCSLPGLIIGISTIASAILLQLIFKCFKRKIDFISVIIFAVISQSAYVYFNINSSVQIFTTIASILIGILFLYVCVQAFGAVFYRGIQSRFTIDESICFSIFIIAAASGLQGVYIFDVNVSNAIVGFLLLLCSRTFTRLTTIYFASLLGIGMAMTNSAITYIAVFVLYSVVCASLADKHKVFSVIGLIISDMVFGLFFRAYAVYTYLTILPLVLMGCMFIFIPERFFDKIKGFSYSYDDNLINEFIISGQRQILTQKLIRLSELFKQMQVAYRNLSVGEIDKKNVCEVLTDELINKQCKFCPKYNICLENIKIKEALKSLFEFGIEKGKVNILDANNLLTTNCNELNSLISETNQSLLNYYEYEKAVKTQDNGKMIVAEQMSGTSDILLELSNLVVGGECVNQKLSKTLLDELTINKVVVNEVVVLDGECGVERVLMVVRNSDVLSSAINESLFSVCRLNFINITRKMTRMAGWSILCFVPAPKYSLSIGYATSSKENNNLSGDSYGFTKLSDTRMLFALADGMGHGKRANEISTAALSLIENFYKSGFSSQTIISSVNKILLPSGEENFTTLDACVVDLSNGTADFVKIGATASVVKSVDGSSLVVSDSLPLGIISGVTPKVQKKVLKSGDIIVIASDGVVDCFDGLEDFLTFVNNERVINVQMFADNILEEVQSREKEHKDDKTIIAIKLNQFLKTN